MKASIVSILLFLFPALLIAQLSDTLIQRSALTAGSFAINIQNDIYIDVGEKTNIYDFQNNHLMIYRLNLQLQVIDSLDVTATFGNDTTQFRVIKIIEVGTDSMLIFTHALSYPQNVILSKTFGILTNRDLTVLDTFKIKPFNDSIDCACYGILEVNNQIYVSGTLYPSPGIPTNGYLARINTQGDILEETIVPQTLFAPSLRDLAIVNLAYYDNHLALYLYGIVPYTLAIYDLNLEFDTIISLGVHTGFLHGVINFLPMPNQAPLLYTILSQSPVNAPRDSLHDGMYEYLALLSVNSDFTFSSVDTFTYTWDIINPTEVYGSQTSWGTISYYRTPDSTVFGCTNIYTGADILGLRPSNHTYLYGVNANTKTTNWHKIYSNGYSHSLEEVVSLPGNQTLLVFNENNWDRLGYDNIAIRLIIIDGNGNPIGVPEQEQELLSISLELYPNPSTETVNVAGLPAQGLFTYYITNMQGQQVATGQISSSQNTIEINLLPAGTYQLAVVNKYGFGQATKLVKL